MITKLSVVERQILSNQNEILKYLNPEEKDNYQENIEILTQGFELEYEGVFTVYPESNCIIYEICKETIDILNMFRLLKISIDKLGDEAKSKLVLPQLSFDGFSANDDPHFRYAKFMIETQNKWQEQRDVDLDSFGSINRYRRMLKIYHTHGALSKKQYSLSELEQFQNV